MAPGRIAFPSLLPRSLTNRVFALYGATLMVFFCIGLGTFLTYQYRQQIEETQRASVMLIEVVAQAVQDSAVIGDYDTVRRTLERSVQGSVFASAAYIDVKGGSLVAESRTRTPTSPPNWLVRWAEGELYDVNRNVTVGGRDYGILRLRFDARSVAGDLWTLTTLVAGVGLVSLLLGLAPMHLLLRRWLGGLDRLQTFDKRLAQGTLDPASLDVGAAPIEIARVVEMFKRTAELVRERELSRRALDNQKFALDQHAIVSMTDLDGRITYANDRFCQITGYSREELIGQNHRIINSGQQSPEFFAKLWQTIASGQVWRGEICNRNRHGELYWVYATLVPLAGTDGLPEQYIAIRTDITDRKAIESSLQAAKEAAEQANRSKSQFLANMSHEIRTPLNAVLGMLKLLQSTELTSRQDDYVTKTEGAARSLLVLLNDILDFSKIEADKLTLDPRPFRIDQLLRDLSVVLSASAGSKPLEVLFDIDPALPRSLVGDDMRLRQVLINLGGNAIKFTDHGEVVIGLRVVDRDDDAVLLRFSVRDTGIGISAEQQQRIFSGFSQAEASTTRRFGGTGLGLAISRRLVGMMGGQISLDSEPGRGSEFGFSLRLPLAAQERLTDVAARRAAPELKGLRALVVDDNPTARGLLCEMVRTLGWQADAADGGPQALALSREAADRGEPYDVAFVDWQMPGMDGWETGLRLRQAAGTQRAATVMMVTAHGREMLAQRSPSEQAVLGGFLVKPVTASMLMDAVADARLGAAAPPPIPAFRPGGRLRGLKLLVVEDNPNNQQVAQELLMAEGARVELADNGERGVEAVFAAQPPFDAVLMDLQMPVMDGYTATARIRQHPGCAALPIIAMTANAMSSDREACLAAGMNDHVGKPFELSDLVSAIRRHTGREDEPSAPPSPSVQFSPAQLQGAAAAQIELAAAVQRLGGNAAVYGRMLRTFLHDLPGQMQRLQEHAQQSQWREAAVAAHTLKGLAGMIGAVQLQAAAAQAEWLLEKTPEQAQPALRALEEAAQQVLREPQWAAQLGSSAAAGAAGLDEAAGRERFEQLLVLLQASDMRAVDLFEQLRHQPWLREASGCDELEAAIDSLDFDSAHRIGRRIGTKALR